MCRWSGFRRTISHASRSLWHSLLRYFLAEDACRGIDTQGSLAKAWADMTKAGVKRIKSDDIAA